MDILTDFFKIISGITACRHCGVALFRTEAHVFYNRPYCNRACVLADLNTLELPKDEPEDLDAAARAAGAL